MGEKQKIVIIGGGIHGVTCAIELAEKGFDVTILERNQDILQGTSGATHNRAHLGYHYPRSTETAIECLKGFKYFEKRYPNALRYLPEAYYAVAKHSSKTKTKEFIKFCNKIDIPCKIEWPSPEFLKRDLLACSFRVPEPIFNLKILSRLLKKELSEKNVCIKLGSEVIGAERVSNNTYMVIAHEGRRSANYPAGIVINATYSHTNNILSIFKLEKDMINYSLQKTEIVVAKTKKDIPALTIIDGPFLSVMPYAGYPEHVLVYDVIYSVVQEERGYFCNSLKDSKSNWEKMVEHGIKYFPFMQGLEYVRSLWGYRPTRPGETAECRQTRLKLHKDAPGLYSILEGKFISAPLIAKDVVQMIRRHGVIR